MVPENPMLSDRVDAVRLAVMSSTFRAWLRLQGARQTRKNPAGRGSSLKEETPMTGNERLSNHHRLPTPKPASCAFSQRGVASAPHCSRDGRDIE
jgi:hypothetical protein